MKKDEKITPKTSNCDNQKTQTQTQQSDRNSRDMFIPSSVFPPFLLAKHQIKSYMYVYFYSK